jgi:hypothetical protein
VWAVPRHACEESCIFGDIHRGTVRAPYTVMTRIPMTPFVLSMLAVITACGGSPDDGSEASGGSTASSGGGGVAEGGGPGASGGGGTGPQGSGGSSVGGGGGGGGVPLPPCTLTIAPGDDFVASFSALSAGDTLCLADGVYPQAMDIPTGMNVRAVNDGMAELDGGGVLGVEWAGGVLQMLGDNASVRGLRVHHAGPFSDACTIRGTNNTMRVMSCSHGGSHKHKIPLKVGGSGHLIEDSWFFGEGRYVVQCYVGENVTFRRNVARWDSTAPNEPSEPNAAFSIYNCSDITIENNISLDYGVPATPMQHGGDFYSPQNPSVYPIGNQNNHYLGNMAVNHAVGTNNRFGLRYDASTLTYDNVIRDFYVKGSNVGMVINNAVVDPVIADCTMIDVGQASNVGANCGSGADLTTRYVDRVKTTAPLFPWKNEDVIKAQMCAPGERQSDWCQSSLSLSDYVLAP